MIAISREVQNNIPIPLYILHDLSVAAFVSSLLPSVQYDVEKTHSK